MNLDFTFFATSILLGVGLAMDAFSVSLANGLNSPSMSRKRMCGIAGIYSFFQFLMPMIGWICVSSVAKAFGVFEKFIPWIALALLGFIGGKMLIEGIKNKEEEQKCGDNTLGAMLVQGVATSIDALSTGFTISDYSGWMALLCAAIIAAVTFIICFIGVELGKNFGTRLAGKAGIFGGIVLIIIGIEIFITGIM